MKRKLLFVLTALSVGVVQAQSYPAKAVRLIVPSAPGDGADLLARALGARLQEALGQPFLVENRSGAGGVIGSELVAKAAADGYTLIVAHAGSHAINAALFPKLSYDPQRDFTPVILLMTAPNVLVVNPSLPIKTVQEFVAYVKKQPGKLGYASGGNGSSAHLTMEAFKNATGTDIVHVPYKGSTPALTDIIGGQIPLMFVNLPPAVPHIKSGKLRAIAVTTVRRASALPDVPSVAESGMAGLAGFETIAWFGVLGPAGLPREIVQRLNAESAKVMQTDDWKARVAVLGGDSAPGTPEVFAERIRGDIARWKKIVADAGIKPE